MSHRPAAMIQITLPRAICDFTQFNWIKYERIKLIHIGRLSVEILRVSETLSLQMSKVRMSLSTTQRIGPLFSILLVLSSTIQAKCLEAVGSSFKDSINGFYEITRAPWNNRYSFLVRPYSQNIAKHYLKHFLWQHSKDGVDYSAVLFF